VADVTCPKCNEGKVYVRQSVDRFMDKPSFFAACNRHLVNQCDWKRNLVPAEPLSVGLRARDRMYCPSCDDGVILVQINRNGPDVGSYFLGCGNYRTTDCTWTHPLTRSMPITVDYECFRSVDVDGIITTFKKSAEAQSKQLKSAAKIKVPSDQPTVASSAAVAPIDHYLIIGDGPYIQESTSYRPKSYRGQCSCGQWSAYRMSEAGLRTAHGRHRDEWEQTIG